MRKIIKKNITLFNTFTSIILQFVTLLNGFIIPKLILTYFGSEVNGLVSSITQFLGYIYLVEGGITGVLMSKMYKPLYDKDDNKISSIIKTSNVFYKKISFIFVVYTFCLAVLYPILVKSSFSYSYIFALVVIMSIGLLIQYTFSLTYKTLLNADKKVYIVSITQSVILLLNIIMAYLSLKIYPSIHVLKFLSSIVFVIQPIVYSYTIKKHFKIDGTAKIDNELLKNRWDGFAINVAAFIHFNTDIVILNIFTNLKTVSIYAIYNLVISGLRQIITAITSAIYPTMGHIYAKGIRNEIDEFFDIYELVTFFIVFVVFSVSFILITPFVELYTSNINDVNYCIPILGYLLLLAEMVYLIKSPHINLAYSANKFKEMTWPSIFEAILNFSISILLVKQFGIIGVAIGTLIAMIFRTIYQIIFLKKCILNRDTSIFFKKLLLFGMVFVILIILEKKYLYFPTVNLINWILYGIIYLIISVISYGILILLFYKKDLSKLIERRNYND